MFSLFSIPSDYFGMLSKQSMKNFRENVQNNNFFESTTTTTEQGTDNNMTEFEQTKKLAEQGDASKQNTPTSPSHYKQGGIECIDAIRAMTSSMHGDGFKIACLKDVVKYVWRHEHKSGLEDLKKAQVYLNWAIEQMEKGKD